MTAHPKQKVPRSHRGMRRAHSALKPKNLTPCPKCGEKKLPHHVCPSCGTYKGEKIIEVKSKK